MKVDIQSNDDENFKVHNTQKQEDSELEELPVEDKEEPQKKERPRQPWEGKQAVNVENPKRRGWFDGTSWGN